MSDEDEKLAEKALDKYLSSIPKAQNLDNLAADLQAEQAGLSRQEIAQRAAAGTLPIGQNENGEQIFAPKAEAVFDPETAVPPEHKWVDRGLVMSCEGAGHPNHRHFKIKARR